MLGVRGGGRGEGDEREKGGREGERERGWEMRGKRGEIGGREMRGREGDEREGGR